MPENTSFISKTTLSKPTYKKRNLGILITTSVAVLIVSIVVLVGVYFYSTVLDNNFKSLTEEFESIKKEFEVKSINSLIQIAASVDVAKQLLNSHTAVSGLFEFLEVSTVPQVRFSSFSYENVEEAGRNIISLQGEAISFKALAEQLLVFENNKFAEEMSLFDIGLQSNGNVGFKVIIKINTEITKYFKK